ncbi:phage integrase Arm DNA-binding domain-containing protein [Serratia symbiotica]|uniref:phage integrase Arm DNA-binding domain-containing protein n=1 Tax=Serratia symbiotica TaxID=138074 RepID=UPI0013602BCE|nr:tyrosine-type recombinase/integrase [Serratia symbiotica]MBQ0955938.1 phage integrase Arm DNA-binding domain-containing protein [Serratia symbiotica]
MARKRTHSRRDLPPNLYVRNNGYYCYRDPRNGKEFGLGTNKKEAVNQAIEANITLVESYSQSRLIDRLIGNNATSMLTWLDRYHEIINKRGLREKTLRDYSGRINLLKEYFVGTNLQEITTKDIAKLLNSYTDQGKAASAKLMRSTLLDIFREAIAEGMIQLNPVEATRNPRVEVKRERLSLENFLLIRQAATTLPSWIGLSMDIALLTGRRLGDIRKMKWSDIKDDKLYVEQQKTGVKLSIPLSIGLPAVDMTLNTVIEICQKINAGSETILASRKQEMLGEKTISKWFAKSRELTLLSWSGSPPSFHEIRSLSARLYTDTISGDFAQKLLGHKSAAMTEKYQDSRGSEWIEIAV